MVDFKYDFSFLLKMIKFVFLPVLAVVILTAFIIVIYSKKVKKKDIQKYNYLVEFWTTLLAIMVIGALLAVTIGFSISLTESIKMYNLIEGNEIIYYIVLATPLIPLLFLVIYIYRMIIVLINKPAKQRKIDVPEKEIVPEPSVVVQNNETVQNEENKNNTMEFSSPLNFSEKVESEMPKEVEIDTKETLNNNPQLENNSSEEESKNSDDEVEELELL